MPEIVAVIPYTPFILAKQANANCPRDVQFHLAQHFNSAASADFLIRRVSEESVCAGFASLTNIMHLRASGTITIELAMLAGNVCTNASVPKSL